MSEDKNEYPEELKAGAKGLLHMLLAADDVVRMKYLKGELTRKEASKLGGNIAVVVDGVVLEALRNRETAEAIVPVLVDKIENGKANPLPYTHILQMLAYRHQLEIQGKVQNPSKVVAAFREVKSEMGLDDIEEQRGELEEEVEEKLEQRIEKWEENPMFG